MSGPWLTVIGIGEDGVDGFTPAARRALETAEVIFAPQRHLEMVPDGAAERLVWPVPFADGLAQLLALRPRRTVVLASGDPFWFGAGSVIARHLTSEEWVCLPGLSSFALAAARLRWPLEQALCLGLHAAPVARLHPYLADGRRALVTQRDGAAVADLAHWLVAQGFGASTLTVMEALGGPRERVRSTSAAAYKFEDVAHPVIVAVEMQGPGLSLVPGLPEETFDHDGQITKSPIRALTLAALEPRPGARLWDIGAGSGSVTLEWLRSDVTTQAVAIEHRADRAERIRGTAARLGLDRVQVVVAQAPDGLDGLPPPQAVFLGGGLSQDLVRAVLSHLAPGTRLVANAVTLESEALVCALQAEIGGALMRVEISRPLALGSKRGWQASYPVTQWSVTL